jgi:hypothetical protein
MRVTNDIQFSIPNKAKYAEPWMIGSDNKRLFEVLSQDINDVFIFKWRCGKQIQVNGNTVPIE